MSILFIGSEITKKNSGGAAVSKRNYENLRNIYENKEIHSFFLSNENIEVTYENVRIEKRNKNKLSRIIEFISLYAGGLNKNIEQKILLDIERNNYKVIFLDLSLYGRLAKKIKEKFKYIKIITFFHNVEKDYILSMIKVAGFKYSLVYPAYLYNEKLAIKYSDILICLNERDEKRLKELYNPKQQIHLLPVSFIDDYKKNVINKNFQKKKTLLFVGSLFFANIEGITWFLNNVFSNLENVTLRIVGKDMEKKRSEFERDNVEVIGTVDDLEKEYENADYIITPILSGSGMKVKTAEALKFGKKIFGTEEAFQGYDINNIDSCILCKNAHDFIESINKSVCQDRDKFYLQSRQLFLEKYSYESSIKKLKKILREENIESKDNFRHMD